MSRRAPRGRSERGRARRRDLIPPPSPGAGRPVRWAVLPASSADAQKFHAVALTLLALVLSGCSCPGPRCDIVPAAIDRDVLLENATGQIQFRQPLPQGCSEELRATSVEAEVFDEDNQRVPTTASFTQNAEGVDVDIQVETGAPGWYYLRVRIEPSIALMQSSIIVAKAALNRPPLVLSHVCGHAAATDGGTFFCNGVPYHADAGVKDAPPTATLLDVRGDVVWIWRESRIERYQDAPNGAVMEPSTAFTETTRPRLLVGTDDGDDLFVVTDAEVARVGYRNDALVELVRNPLGTTAVPEYGVVSNDVLFLFAPTTSISVRGKTTACGYQLEGDLLTKLPACQELTGAPMGTAHGAAWFWEEGLLRLLRADDSGELRSDHSLRLPTGVLAPAAVHAAPLFQLSPSRERLSVAEVPGRLVFEKFPTDFDFRTASAFPTAAIFVDSANRTRVFAR